MWTTDPAVLPAGVATVAPVVYLATNFPGEGAAREPFAGKFAAEELTKFVQDKSIPLVTTLDTNPASRQYLRKLFELQAPKAMAFFDAEAAGADEFDVALREAAKANEGAVYFVRANAMDNEGALKFFGLSADSLPALVVHDTVEDKKYVYSKAEPAEIQSWITRFRAGEVDASIKSEEPPAENDGPVTVVVAKTFASIVTDSKKDVLIEFYAPWCGHCKKLAPVYEKVAEHFSGRATVTVAKMDATANDIPDKRMTVTGFPTIFMVKGATTGELVSYSGDRTEQDLVDFVKKHAAATHDEL